MAKTIEVNLSLNDLRDDKIREAKKDVIQKESETSSDLSATFSRENLAALRKMGPCDGIRFYPAVNNNELVMIAWGVKDGNDLIGSKYFCLVSNVDGAVHVDGATPSNGIDKVSTKLAINLIKGDGSGADIIKELNDVRQVEGSDMYLKALFDSSFFLDENSDYLNILFEVVDLKLNDGSSTKKTISGHIQYKDEDKNVQVLSFLPCPPNCGAGGYASSGGGK